MSNEEYDHLYKIILVGDATVGKTHLLSRYIRGSLPSVAKATIGVEFATRTIPLAVGGTVKAQIWDTAGQERYRSITSAHYRRSAGAILVYDITKKKTFLNISKWLEEIRQNSEKDIVIMLVGNKVDLAEEDETKRKVTYEQGASFARENNLFFSEASAVSKLNVKHIFENLLQEIYNNRLKDNNSVSSTRSHETYESAIQITNAKNIIKLNDKNNKYNENNANQMKCC
ncbi:ras-related protein Rab-11B, putative [Plasmodium vinckei vinckei]|uniref:Ras-related protein Rab-11B, putative n=1 Tax=Plasmodium vinckei vinckei TaxID=54757 RepID=A0A449BZ22_PLAVN|nr:ras-related protein Rab-11B, putative [Plasmodium vinckei vinckei]KEG04980.1 rab family, other [Plasmodium vinckei vinckei]VEV58631.1 ras-related protein Rab-11B, putative [Plasmodium vinckei vinckei]